ncbi:hypothetical protein BH20ACT13_BH20ACT13_05470 [soil metagenome]
MAERADSGAGSESADADSGTVRPLEPSGSRPKPARGSLETLALAGIGVFALGADRAEELADELAQRLAIDPEETRAIVVDVFESWRRELGRVGESSSSAASRVGVELGIASRDALDELELRVAQLEHRLRLLER